MILAIDKVIFLSCFREQVSLIVRAYSGKVILLREERRCFTFSFTLSLGRSDANVALMPPNDR